MKTDNLYLVGWIDALKKTSPIQFRQSSHSLFSSKMPSTAMMTMVTAIHKATATIAAAAVIVGGGGDISFREEILKKSMMIAAVKRRATKRRAATDLEFFSIVKRFVEMLPRSAFWISVVQNDASVKILYLETISRKNVPQFESIFQQVRFEMKPQSRQTIRASHRRGVGE